MNFIDPATLGGLPGVIGSERFAPYLAAQAGNQHEAVRLYAWNVEASAAILGAYAPLEVGVRNSMHDQLTATFGRPDWWEKAPLSSDTADEIDEVISRLEGREEAEAKKGRAWTWTEGHVVADLSASFWEGLLANKYHANMWEKGLSSAFPRYTGRRGDLKIRMERLRRLRNRAAHHEPVFARDLLVDHRFMCELAGFVADDLETWVMSHSRLPMAVNGRPDTISGKRPTRF